MTEAREQDMSSASLRDIFGGRRGRLLLALLFAEFGGAVQSIAYSSVLPVASNDLGGATLFGATLLSGVFASILVLAAGPGVFGRFRPARSLLFATVLYLAGVGLAAGAVTMVMVLAGSIVRGLAGGLLAGFGLTAVGALYDGALRRRVLGLFALMWLLPSLAGPVINAAVTVAFGWRAAMAWPALLVLAGRALVGRDVKIIPWKRSAPRRLNLGHAVSLIAGLIVAAAAPAPHNGAGVAMLAVGATVAVVASLRILAAQIGSDRGRLRTTATMFGLCLAFFGANGIVSLAAIDGLGHGVVAGTSTVGAALLAWSVTGMRSGKLDARLGDTTVAGLALLTLGLAADTFILLGTAGSTLALGLLVGSSAAGGLGMGLAYNRVSSAGLDGLSAEYVYRAAVAVEFAETSGTAVAALASGGVYSLARSLGAEASASVGYAFALLAVAACLTTVLAVRGRAAARPGERTESVRSQAKER